MQSRVFETTETIDYSIVVNRQLDRIASIRSGISKYLERKYDFDMEVQEVAFWDYLLSVETLHKILLPYLRGNSLKYIILAKELHKVIRRLARCSDRNCEELKKKRNEILKKLPKETFDNIVSSLLYYDQLSQIIDLALEEMLKQLNEAGLLMRGRTVSVGAVNVPGSLNRESV